MARDKTDEVDPATVAGIQVLIDFKKNKLTYKEARKRFKFFTGLSDDITQRFIASMSKENNPNNVIPFPKREKT
jgi:hypothetical protein